MSKITLNNIGSIADSPTTAANTINANNTVIVNGLNNTLSLDGTQPNQMGSQLDMNSNQIINLPFPATSASPLRLQDLNSFTGGGTISTLPVGGTTLQPLVKTSNANYAVGWNTITGSGSTVQATAPTIVNATLTTPTSTSATINTPTITSATINSSTLNSPTLVTPTLGVATATSINGSTVSPGHYTGEPSNGSALAGQIGEFVTSVLASGSAVALTTNVAKTVTSISLTAGDWDVWGSVSYTQPGTTVYANTIASINTTTNVLGTELTNWLVNSYPSSYTPSSAITQVAPTVRMSLSATTTVYLVTQTSFGTSTSSGYGYISARRVR